LHARQIGLQSTFLDIILPCYNPHENWEQVVIESFTRFCSLAERPDTGLILVNDGSNSGIRDNSEDVIRKQIPNLKWIDLSSNQGKGAALRAGIISSNASFQIYTDIDFPYRTESMVELWKILQTDEYSVVAAVKDKDYYNHLPAIRSLISKSLQTMTRLLLGLRISDTQCGLKGMNNRGKVWFLKTTIDRYLFDLEFIFLVSRSKHDNVLAMSATVRPEIVFSKMHLGILIRESGNFIRILIKRIAN